MSAKSFSDTPIEPGQVPKAYNPADVEDKWYKYWIDHGYTCVPKLIFRFS